ncbi:integral membrane protein [Glarea lozoyensis ATCC 20868]|uniref:Integral membrane protein n=1 Tax=Glarea lozoyensis (strain ATCC 20868 / MF5171) TaxID=1116229 RepID=S3CNX7_GLAL2|nr:uncharacterized protein GLAREA_04993 [Glarea lozoyensis ATCC 20868]EPE28202.1 integral membrane protein [Glarea lozoyensis ATCC 20868]
MSTPPHAVDPNDLGHGPLVMGVTWTFCTVAIIAVSVRFWVRVSVTKKLYVEDWLMLLAAALNLVCQSCLTVCFTYGFGKHDKALNFKQAVGIAKWIWMSFTPGITSSIVSRISICILLVRIFGVRVWLKWLLIVLTVFQVAMSVALALTSWLQVRPVEGLWNPKIHAHRLSPEVVAREGNVGGALFALGDLCYVLFPVMIVWKLNMALRQKLGLIFLLAMSLFTMGCSIAKAVVAASGTKTTADKQYKSSLALMWSSLEQSFVIIMGCAPPLSSVTKLQVPIAERLISSLRKLVSSQGSKSKLDSAEGLGQSKNGMYYELGFTGQTESESVVQAGNTDLSTHQTYDSSIDPKKILRTDNFNVKSDRVGDP